MPQRGISKACLRGRRRSRVSAMRSDRDDVDAWFAGADAHDAGFAETNNPHAAGSSQHAEWADGFRASALRDAEGRS